MVFDLFLLSCLRNIFFQTTIRKKDKEFLYLVNVSISIFIIFVKPPQFNFHPVLVCVSQCDHGPPGLDSLPQLRRS